MTSRKACQAMQWYGEIMLSSLEKIFERYIKKDPGKALSAIILVLVGGSTILVFGDRIVVVVLSWIFIALIAVLVWILLLNSPRLFG